MKRLGLYAIYAIVFFMLLYCGLSQSSAPSSVPGTENGQASRVDLLS